jgi:hypothetical protein
MSRIWIRLCLDSYSLKKFELLFRSENLVSRKTDFPVNEMITNGRKKQHLN